VSSSKHRDSVQERSRAEERFQLLADCATDYAFILFDPENCITNWSIGAERILGYTEAEIMGQSGALFFTPEDRSNGAVEQELETAQREGRAEDERWHLRKDGSRFWASGVMTALREAGALIGFAKVLRDLTERKKLEQERQLLSSVIANTPEFVGISGLDGVPVYANGPAMAMVGARDFEEVRQTPVPDYFVPEERAFVRDVVLPTVQQQGSWRGELHFQHLRTGEVIPVLYDVFRVDDPVTGEPTHFATITRDLREQKRAEQTLRESEERLQLAQLVAGIATWDWNIAENRCQWSESMGPLFGLPVGTSLGNVDAFLAQVYLEDRAAVESSLQNTMRQGTHYEVQFRTVWPDGSVHWLFAVGRVFRSPQGDPVRLLGVATDVTDRKKAEDQAEQERQQIQEEIQRTSQILERTKDEVRELAIRLVNVQDEERRRMARELHDTAAQRLALLEMELHSLGQQPSTASEIPGHRVQRLKQRTTELSNELRQLAHQLHPSILDHFGLRVALRQLINDFNEHWAQPIEFFISDLPDNIPLPTATALYRIAQEALRNIAKYAPGALILVALKGSKKHLLLSIEDDGPGFVYRKSERQRGLGLISMEERVHLLGGKLVVRTRPGNGTRIYVRIPLAECGVSDAGRTLANPECRTSG
jgi:PAS domain S-box-containing protein